MARKYDRSLISSSGFPEAITRSSRGVWVCQHSRSLFRHEYRSPFVRHTKAFLCSLQKPRVKPERLPNPNGKGKEKLRRKTSKQTNLHPFTHRQTPPPTTTNQTKAMPHPKIEVNKGIVTIKSSMASQ